MNGKPREKWLLPTLLRAHPGNHVAEIREKHCDRDGLDKSEKQAVYECN